MQVQDNTVTHTHTHTHTVSVTRTYPRTLTETTDPQLVDDALAAFYEAAKDAPDALYYSKNALTVIAAAMLEGSAVCVRYEHDNEITARVIFPSAILFTKDSQICVRGFCTYRREVKSFRVDRMACVHPLAMPGEVAA